jgi:hypothetical protein
VSCQPHRAWVSRAVKDSVDSPGDPCYNYVNAPLLHVEDAPYDDKGRGGQGCRRVDSGYLARDQQQAGYVIGTIRTGAPSHQRSGLSALRARVQPRVASSISTVGISAPQGWSVRATFLSSVGMRDVKGAGSAQKVTCLACVARHVGYRCCLSERATSVDPLLPPASRDDVVACDWSAAQGESAP